MAEVLPRLEYMLGDQGRPAHEIQKITASYFAEVAPGTEEHLEGLVFDNDGRMFVCNIYKSLIYEVDMNTRKASVFYEFKDSAFKPGAIKFHKDGRMFVAGVDLKSKPMGEHGGVIAVDPKTKTEEWILKGWNIDDLVFDEKGGFYFTNYIGNPETKEGSIEYVDPEYKTCTTVVGGLAAPNGVALSKDYKVLWFTTIADGVLHRYDLENPFHYTTPYKFTGFYGPDSCEIDDDDNLYVAMSRQGRIMVFNYFGYPIAEVNTPGYEQGNLLGTTHPMVHPTEKVLYFTAHDANKPNGANIMRCGTYTIGNTKNFQFL